METVNGSSTVPRFCQGKLWFLCFRLELGIMSAWKSVSKALEHIATAILPPCAWNATFCYTILSEPRAQRVDFGAM